MKDIEFGTVNQYCNHEFVKLSKTWQEMELTSWSAGGSKTYGPSTHSKEIMVCSKCGEVLDPWKKEK